jgi:hypothetical protein
MTDIVEEIARAIYGVSHKICCGEGPAADDESWRSYLPEARIAYEVMARSDGELVERLWSATKHGDEDHHTWLRDAYTAFFAGEPVPAPRGRGNKEARIAELEAQVAALRGSGHEG